MSGREDWESAAPDQTIVWTTYVLANDDICTRFGIRVEPGDSVDVELADRTAIRFTVKRLEKWAPK